MKSNVYIILLIFNCLVSAISQILLKISANKKYLKPIYQYINPYVILGYGMLMLVVILNIYVMKFVSLTIVSIFSEALSLIFAILSGYLFFNEKIRLNKIIGAFVIIIGIVIICI